MSNKIRRLSIGAEIKEQFHIGVGTNFPVFIEGKKQDRVVSNIEETENHFLVYSKCDGEIQLWKKIPKNNITTIEYEIQ